MRYICEEQTATFPAVHDSCCPALYVQSTSLRASHAQSWCVDETPLHMPRLQDHTGYFWLYGDSACNPCPHVWFLPNAQHGDRAIPVRLLLLEHRFHLHDHLCPCPSRPSCPCFSAASLPSSPSPFAFFAYSTLRRLVVEVPSSRYSGANVRHTTLPVVSTRHSIDERSRGELG